ncbi:MAG: 50S ribosomal protein L19 [Dehalococcoidia bacterium]|nr:50S ribosomal protein L19 [Dehalococcoidia bacterium]
MNVTSLIKDKPNPDIPDIAPGDTVKVSVRVVEAGRERTQLFQGVVIKVRRGGDGGNFTIRRVVRSIGVEHTFPLYSPLLEKIEIVRHGKVRRARLYYLRGLSGKASRIKEKRSGKKKPGQD